MKLIPKYQSPWTPINYKPPENSEPKSSKSSSKKINVRGSSVTAEPVSKDRELSYGTGRYSLQLYLNDKPLSGTDPVGEFNVAGEPLIGTRDPVGMDMFIYQNTRNNPNSKLIIGHDAITDEFPYLSKGTEMLSLSPNNYTAIKVNKPKTSLKFFERPLSKINNQERLGIPKDVTIVESPLFKK